MKFYNAKLLFQIEQFQVIRSIVNMFFILNYLTGKVRNGRYSGLEE